MTIIYFCDKLERLEIEEIISPLTEEVASARNWYLQSSIENNHSLLEYTERLDWKNAVVTCSELQNIVEVPIESIEEYLKCIDSNLPATLTIFVDQPVPNENIPNMGIDDVGHTFIGISQNGNTSIFGFYPEGLAKPTNTTHGSALGNDQEHWFDVPITKNISRSELNSILTYVYNFRNSTYDLNDFNCTDFGINVGNRAGIGLPDSYNSWPEGGGSKPGSLGQDIRNMQLPSGSTRTTNGQDAPNNINTCTN
ncbi:hypothetical protein DWB61_05560 [Ancylomarina euxinus]|uniref:Uncharacterized protein n=1 Tax=Ancylomarina euxinus TaxID=2283627 RepID=A0A425Y467_9BACT|nr:hypothetical protein [Ancylomarina euxinus]MCZ4694503.1 hypothetical protein [Ancylomarina euxinus]MUP14046.1 hypothetical protein [Ancylomarina euxinus]RRG22906.1 hypothetical protein DWB61_05560 [Ancylomarina euxinus]